LEGVLENRRKFREVISHHLDWIMHARQESNFCPLRNSLNFIFTGKSEELRAAPDAERDAGI
jgi:hypothetical protein